MMEPCCADPVASAAVGRGPCQPAGCACPGGVRWTPVLLAASCGLAAVAAGFELREPRVLPDRAFEFLIGGELRGTYLVIRRGDTPDRLTTPVQVTWPPDGPVRVDADGSSAARGFYRVEAVPVDAPRDLDGDGLDDVFELTYPLAFDPLDPTDAAGDFDGDGFDNGEEYRRGTDPTDPASRPLIRVSTAPAADETGVSVQRELTVLFEKPVAVETQLSHERFFLEFGGRRLLARTAIALDRSRAWLFPLEPLPPGARIKAVFDATGIRDALGRAVDADGDGQPGGRLEFGYTTFGATPVLGTAVVGQVFDSEFQPDGAGGFTNRPLAGVLITVDGAEQTLRTTTDASGFFRLEPSPAGRFFVHVDGRNAAGSRWPGGTYYPFLGKAWEASPGRTNNLAGGTGVVYLPRIVAGTLVPVSASTATEITFPPEVLARQPELAGVTITVPANALFADDGTRGGRVGIAPVPPDRLPEPLPAGLQLPLVITIQTDGALNFDLPVPVRFPNLPDPVTGEVLPPGGQGLLWSFDHDVGRWEIQGTMTVSPDGRFAVSDPGVGVRQPGWHGFAPGTPPGPFGFRQSRSCDAAVFSGTVGCVASFVPVVSTAQCLALNVGGGLLQSAGDCIDFSRGEFTDDYFGCGMSLMGTSFGIAGCLLESVPIVGQAVGCGLGAISIARACFPAAPAGAGRPSRHGPVEEASEVVWRVYELHLRIVEEYAEILRLLTGSSVWVEAVHVEAGGWLEQQRQVTELLRRFVAFAAPNSSGGVPISPAELAAWKAAPRPAGFPAAAFDQMADYHNRTFAFYQQGLMTHAAAGRSDFQDRDQMRAAIRRWLDLFAELEALGATVFSLPDAHAAFLDELERRGTSAPLDHLDRLFFRLELLYTDVDLLGTPLVRSPQHGRMLGDGRLPFAALAPKALYLAEFFDPSRNLYGKVHFRTGPSGRVTQMPKVDLTGVEDQPDTDADGLPNLGEWVVGFLDPLNPDTDGQGGNDREDLLAALESGRAGPLSTGLVAAVDTDGEAADLAAHERYTLVADSGGGLVVVEVDGLNLTRVAVIPTPGLARAVAVDGHWAVGGDSRGVLTVLDLSRPVAELAIPRARLSAGAPVWGVAVANPVAFVGLDSGQLLAVNLEAGVIVDRLRVSAQKVEDVVVSGSKVAALAAATVHLFDWDGASLRRTGQVPSDGNPTSPFGGRSRLFADGRRVFATHRTGFNVFATTGPAPELLRRVETTQLHWKQIISPDGLLGVAAMGVNFGARPVDDNVSLYDLGAPAGSEGFLATLATPGIARAVLSRQGFVHAADHQAGLQVLNLNAPDRTGIAPTVTVRLDAGGTTTEPDRWVELVAEAADNIAVREVEFLVNDTRVHTDTSYPFRHRLRAPAAAGAPFVVTARALDIAGNAALSSPLPITVLPDLSPPRLLRTSPTSGQPVGALHEIVALFSERLDPTTVTSTSVVARAAGPDGLFDTDDDTLPSAATQTLRPAGDALVVSLAAPLPPGLYRLEISAALTDLAGHALTGSFAPVFRVAGPADMTDSDRDGLPDAWEIAVSGTDPSQADTNGNGIPDGEEDADGDGLTTLFELFAGTDPTLADTFQTGRSDAALDADGDALTLLQEMFLGTDPTLPDTDGDGWNDEAEITLGSRPTDPRSLPWLFSIAPAHAGLARPAWEPGAGQYAALQQPVGLARPAWEQAAEIPYGTSRGQPPLTLQRNDP